MTPLDVIMCVIGTLWFAVGMCFYASAVVSEKVHYLALAAVLIVTGLAMMAASTVPQHTLGAVLTHQVT